MIVCMYACMHVCMYVCVCKYVYTAFCLLLNHTVSILCPFGLHGAEIHWSKVHLAPAVGH